MSLKKHDSLDVYKNIDNSLGNPSQQVTETEKLVYAAFDSLGEDVLCSLFGKDDAFIPTEHIVALSIALGIYPNKNISVALALTIPQPLIDEYSQGERHSTATDMRHATYFSEEFLKEVIVANLVDNSNKDELVRIRDLAKIFFLQLQNLEKNKTVSLAEWLSSGDTGQSSRFMVSVLSSEISISELAIPHDQGDFTRCENALKAMPSLRKELPKMKLFHPAWGELVDNWDELKRLNTAKKHGEFTSLLKRLTGQ